MAKTAIEILQTAIKTDWVQTQDFTFEYHQNPNFTNFTLGDLLNVEGSALDMFNLCCISVDVPQATASELDTVLGGERRVNIRMQELFRFSAKFRDLKGLGLRNYFKGLWIATHSEYPDTINGSVRIMDGVGNLLFQSTNVTINSVSAVQFDNNSSQIAEFDVQFLSPTLSDFTINNFGKSNYGDVFTATAGVTSNATAGVTAGITLPEGVTQQEYLDDPSAFAPAV